MEDVYEYPKLYARSEAELLKAEFIRKPACNVVMRLIGQWYLPEDRDAVAEHFDVLLRRYTNAKWWIEYESPEGVLLSTYLWQELMQFLADRRYAMEYPIDPLLFVFDLNGTIVNTPFVDKQPLHVLPGRHEVIDPLQVMGKEVHFITQRSGVAWAGLELEETVKEEVSEIAEEFEVDFYCISFGSQPPKYIPENRVFLWKYTEPSYLEDVKPNPGMLIKCIERAGVNPNNVVYIGDLVEDRELVRNANKHFHANIRFVDACIFFGDVTLPDPPRAS